ncbi:MAG: hypothetical protein ACJAZO_004186 [Myxococcota bacterium]
MLDDEESTVIMLPLHAVPYAAVAHIVQLSQVVVCDAEAEGTLR